MSRTLPRLFGGAALGLITAVLSLPPASAVPPERVFSETFDVDVVEVDRFLTKECGFRVTSAMDGHYFETVYFDKDGNITRFTAHPSFRSTLTSPYTSITTADVGLDRFTDNGDGTFSIFGTGIHVKIQGGTKAIGLWRLVVDPMSGELLDERYFGNFDVGADETVTALCEALGPAS